MLVAQAVLFSCWPADSNLRAFYSLKTVISERVRSEITVSQIPLHAAWCLVRLSACSTGEVDFEFVSEFATSVLGWSTRPLAVAARMASGEQEGRVFHAVGERLQRGQAT